MFCKTSPQLSLFDVNNVFPNALPKEDWCYLYRDQIYPLIDEEIFKELYPGECGRPNRSIKKAVSILTLWVWKNIRGEALNFNKQGDLIGSLQHVRR